MSAGIDTEKFIEDIYTKPIIWNRNCGSNKSLTESTWDALSKKFGASSKTNSLFVCVCLQCEYACICQINDNNTPITSVIQMLFSSYSHFHSRYYLNECISVSVPVLKAKWKGLRDMFRVEIKRIPRNDAGEPIIQPHEFDSKWTHYRSLLFLGTFKQFKHKQQQIII